MVSRPVGGGHGVRWALPSWTDVAMKEAVVENASTGVGSPAATVSSGVLGAGAGQATGSAGGGLTAGEATAGGTGHK